MTTAQDILDFWFEEIDPSFWFKKDSYFDEQIKRRFSECYAATVNGDNVAWRKTAQGRLAEVIVLDQFPRNMFRDTAKAFSSDPLALHLAQEAVRSGDDQKLSVIERSFLYMPYMHSEDKKVHEDALKLFAIPGLEENLKFEKLHKVIIDRFGRYPHRNKILGRISTPEEEAFLKEPNSSF